MASLSSFPCHHLSLCGLLPPSPMHPPHQHQALLRSVPPKDSPGHRPGGDCRPHWRPLTYQGGSQSPSAPRTRVRAIDSNGHAILSKPSRQHNHLSCPSQPPPHPFSLSKPHPQPASPLSPSSNTNTPGFHPPILSLSLTAPSREPPSRPAHLSSPRASAFSSPPPVRNAQSVLQR